MFEIAHIWTEHKKDLSNEWYINKKFKKSQEYKSKFKDLNLALFFSDKLYIVQAFWEGLATFQGTYSHYMGFLDP